MKDCWNTISWTDRWITTWNVEQIELLTKWKQKQMQESSNKISIYLKPNTTQALHQIKALDIKHCNMITAKTLITDSWQRYRALSAQGNKDSRIIFYSRFADSPCMEGQTGKIYGRDCIAIWKLYNYHQSWLETEYQGKCWRKNYLFIFSAIVLIF